MAEVEREWIVAGSAPSAADWLPAVREKVPGAATITTNRGFKLFDDESPPDVYFFGDEHLLFPANFGTYREAGRRLAERGVHTVGLARPAKVMKEWDVEWIAEQLTIQIGCWRPWKFVRGKYTAAKLSGLFCVQYALNHGATAVHLIGMEGYGDEGHYFDSGRDSERAKDLQRTADVIGPFTQAAIDACPEVQFIFYGRLNYAPTGANVTLIEDLSEWKSSFNGGGGDFEPTISEPSPTAPRMC